MHLPWRMVAPGDGPEISTSITVDETAELQRLSWQSNVLEIGAAFGYSAVSMALAGARVTSVDPHGVHDSLGAMRVNLDAYKVTDRVNIWPGYSQDVLPALTEQFDVVFIDGDHTAPGVERDVAMARKLLRPGGIMACHDYTEWCCCPGVSLALDNIFPDPPLRLVDSLYLVQL